LQRLTYSMQAPYLQRKFRTGQRLNKVETVKGLINMLIVHQFHMSVPL
jgi:hypothetical protein